MTTHALPLTLTIPPVDLAQRIAKGDERAFRTAFDMYYQGLVRYTTALTRDEDAAHDIVDGVFAKVWLQRRRLHGVQQMRGLLYQRAKLRALDLRKHERRREMKLAAMGLDLSSPAWRDEVQEKIAAIQQALDMLPTQQRKAMTLRLQGHTYKQIAHAMGISEDSATTHCRRAVERMKQVVKEEEQ